MQRPRRLTIEDMNALAAERGGRCISEHYSSTKRLEWECSAGHRWESLVRVVKNQGSWCPYCDGNAPLSLGDANSEAAKHGGKCLSKVYNNSRMRMLWECSEGHTWEACFDQVRRGSWCPQCTSNAPLGIEKVQEVARSRGGRCLSESYKNVSCHLEWECGSEHRWKASASSVIHSGSWCPHCSGNAKSTIEKMRKLARARGGRCLSDKYLGSSTHLLWECSEGHKWEATANNVKRGSWCPSCGDGLGERLTRLAFEQLLEEEFPKVQPQWLHMGRQKGKNLELDRYSEKLGLAFEHQGRQHFVEEASFSAELFEDQLKRDAFKRRACKEKGVTLIEVPEVPAYVPIRKLKEFIRQQCESLGVLLPKEFDETEVNFSPAYRVPHARAMLERVRGTAQKRGGLLLTDHYINNSTKMLFRCKNGHEFGMHWGNVNTGHWRGRCAATQSNATRRHSLDVLKQVATERGGRCLSTSYQNAHEKVLWECAKGHQWEASTHNVKNGGKWCPYCAGRMKKK